ncbi:MAG: hypothetical protein RR667_05380, partial [Muribaculaceae bacterium]
LMLLKFIVPSFVEMIGLPQADFNIPVVYFFAILVAIYCLLYMFVVVKVASVAKVSPLEMKRNVEIQSYRWTKWKSVLTFIVGVISFLLFLQGIAKPSTLESVILIFIGSVLIIGLLFFLFPYVMVYTLSKKSSWIHYCFGNKIHYVKMQFTPHLRSYIPVVFILTILIMIIVFNGTFLKSLVKGQEIMIEETYPYEVAITNPYFENIFYEDIALLQKNVSIEEIQLGSKVSSFIAPNFILNYAAKDFGGKNRVEITEDAADKYGLKIGDVLDGYRFEENSNEQTIHFTITGIIPTENKYTHLYVDWNSPLIKDVITIDEIHLTLAPDTTLDDL